jgi:hypothetical protein
MEWIRSCNLYNAKDPCNVSTKFSNLSSALLDKHISVYISHLFGIRFTLEREKKSTYLVRHNCANLSRIPMNDGTVELKSFKYKTALA